MKKLGRSLWTEACWYPFLPFCGSVYTLCLGASVSVHFKRSFVLVLCGRSEGGVSSYWRVFEAELSQCVDSGLARLVRGAVELVWHPFLFGFIQAIDVPALVL